MKPIINLITIAVVFFSIYFLITPYTANSPEKSSTGSYYSQAEKPSVYLKASPSHIVLGQKSNISWEVNGATSCISGSNNIVPSNWINPGFKGSMTMVPKGNTTLTYICTGPGGVSIKKVDIIIGNELVKTPTRPVTMFYTIEDARPFIDPAAPSQPPLTQTPPIIDNQNPPVVPPTIIVPPTIPDTRNEPATNPSPQIRITLGPIPWKNNSFDYSRPTNISYSPRSSWMIFPQSQPPNITTGDGSSITIYDIYGNMVYQGASGQTVPSLHYGHYFVESASDRSQFFIMPDDYVSTSFLGSNIPYGGGTSGFTMPNQSFHASKFSWGRSGPGSWEKIQTGEDTWDWTEADARMEVASDINQVMIVDSFTPPAWVTDDVILDRFTDFAVAMTKRYTSRYPGRIRYIQILNEPWCCGSINNSFFDYLPYNEVPPAYTELIHKISTAIHAVDPSLIIVGPSIQWGSLSDLQNLADAGINNYIDGISWHEYRLGMYWPDEIDSNSTRVDKQLDTIKSIFPGKKLVINEIGFSGLSALGVNYNSSVSGCGEYGLSYGNWRRDSWYVGMNKVTKLIIMLRAGGIDQINGHIFNLFNPDCAWAGWESGSPEPRGIKPQSSAYLMDAYWLENAGSFEKRVLKGDSVFLYAWRRSNGESIVAAWAIKNTTATLQKEISNATFVDIFGKNVSKTLLTEQPTIIRSNSYSPGELLNEVEKVL